MMKSEDGVHLEKEQSILHNQSLNKLHREAKQQ